MVGDHVATDVTVSTDRTTVTMGLHPNAFSAPLYVLQPGGTRTVLDPFFKVKGTVGTLAGAGPKGVHGGAANQALFNYIYGVAVNLAGDTVYVADHLGHRVRKIQGGTVSTLAGSGTAASVDGNGTAAQLNTPGGLAVDEAGNLYVGERGGNRIRKITAAGVVTTIAGNGSRVRAPAAPVLTGATRTSTTAAGSRALGVRRS